MIYIRGIREHANYIDSSARAYLTFQKEVNETDFPNIESIDYQKKEMTEIQKIQLDLALALFYGIEAKM